MSWMQGLGDALQAFGRAKMVNDEERRRAKQDELQFSLQQQQLQRALARDKIEDLRIAQQDKRQEMLDKRQAAQDFVESAAAGSELNPEAEGILRGGGYGHMIGSQVQGNIPSQFTAPELRPDVGMSVLQPTRRDVQLRDAQLAEQQQRAEQQAFERQKFQEMIRQFGIEQNNLLKRTQISAGPDTQKDYGGYAIANMLPQLIQQGMTADEALKYIQSVMGAFGQRPAQPGMPAPAAPPAAPGAADWVWNPDTGALTKR